MKHYVLEDTSFVLALLDKNDESHYRAWKIFDNLRKLKNHIRVLIPSMVFFETIGVLTRKKINKDELDGKLWRMLHIEEIFNISLVETMSFNLCRKYCEILQDDSFKDDKGLVKYIGIQDFLIAATGIDYDAQILTLDKPMFTRLRKFYPNIYYGKEKNETDRFFLDIKKCIDRIDHIKVVIKK